MTRVIAEFSMSLDGYMAGPGVAIDAPMGEGGEALHDWMFAADAGADNARMKRAMVERTGAVILGRRTFDLGVAHWDGTPFPVPSFVLTHRPLPEGIAPGFSTAGEGIEAALRNARDAAGGRDVRLMGGEVVRQFLAAGLVDELLVQVAPLLLGGGVRPFPDEHRGRLRQTERIAAPHATHLRFDVARG